VEPTATFGGYFRLAVVKGLGVLCSIRKGRPIVSAVLLESGGDDASPPRVIDRFQYVADPHEDFALQLTSLSAALESRFKALSPDAVVVRTMDWHPNRSKGDTAQKRYCTEGVVLAAVRAHVAQGSWLTGAEVGTACGTTKQKIEDQATTICPDEPKEAVAAALAIGTHEFSLGAVFASAANASSRSTPAVA
jgi:hypothetical protein